jgi:starch phosphorylase
MPDTQSSSHQVPISHQHPIAFFSAEFGIVSHLPIYAGGLGVLSGDILKQAADQHLPMVGVGLLYRGEGAIQQITNDGTQLEVDLTYDPLTAGLEHVYIDDMPVFIKVHLSEIDIWVRCWKKTLSDNVTLYLLDTDTDQNHPSQRQICHALYAGTEEELVKQQLILGIGGIKLLGALGIHPALYHELMARLTTVLYVAVRSQYDPDTSFPFEGGLYHTPLELWSDPLSSYHSFG